MTTQERIDPRLSVNKLGEYLTCTAIRRRRILLDAKRPKNFMGPRYNDFYAFAPQYLVSNPLDPDIINNAIDEIQGRQFSTPWDEQNKPLNIDLLTSMLDIPDLLPLEGLTLTALPKDQQHLIIGGVTISVRPEILLTGTHRGREIMGAIKLYLPKTYSLDRATGEYIGTMVHQHLTTFPPQAGIVNRQFCFVVDVPSRAVYTAPGSYIQRRTNVQVACDEICAVWPTI